MRLIDACVAQKIADSDCTKEDAGTVQYVLSHTPTIEAEPIRHGHWEVLKTAIGAEYTVCSECKTDFTFRTNKGTFAKMDLRNAHHCPNCGARMEGNE